MKQVYTTRKSQHFTALALAILLVVGIIININQKPDKESFSAPAAEKSVTEVRPMVSPLTGKPMEIIEVPKEALLGGTPVVFREIGTKRCVGAFIRKEGDQIVGLLCGAVKSELDRDEVIHKFVPVGTSFGDLISWSQFNDPWDQEFLPAP